MDAPTRHQVSLRGASAREITRDDLLQRVSHEREARHFARRAASAALFIQRVWRRYNLTKRVALQLQKEWTILVNNGSESMTKTWISCSLLRPVIFIMIHLVVRPCKIQAQDISCMRSCFIILLESLNSTDPSKNLCSLAMGTLEERRIWNYQVQKLVYLSSFMLAKHDGLNSGSDDMVALTALSMRLVITLSDLKGWKCITDENYEDADKAVKGLIRFMGSSESGLYRAIGRYLSKLHVSLIGNAVQRDDKLLISASAITLAIRPFQLLNQDVNEPVPLEIQCTAEQYCVFILAIPWLIQRTPAVLLPALRHKSVLITCFRTILILDEKVLVKCAEIDQSRASSCPNGLPQVGWLLSNIICLATESENNSVDPSRFTDGVDLVSYIHVINLLAGSLLAVTENIECMQKETEELPEDEENSMDFASKFVLGSDPNSGSLKYMDLLRPICQQWHLCKLMTAVKGDFKDEIGPPMETSSSQNSKTLKLLDIAQFYSNMIRIYSLLNSMAGPLPVLNMLSFIPGFLVNIWGALEHSLFPAGAQTSGDDNARARSTSRIKSESDSSKKQKHPGKDAGNRLASVFHKISGKSTAEVDNTVLAEGPREHNTGGENAFDVWIVKSLKCGPESVSKDTSCLLYLFCTTYAHLLLVLDDIEFYEKQVPFSLEQQQRIASMLNTLVYNGLLHNTGCRNRPLMNAAVRCLQMLYERDCRHRFCPPALWLSPAEKSRPPIAMAARTHEVLSDVKLESSSATSVTSFITTTPYVYPFEERVQMFREFIRMDKASRKMAGELTGPGDRSIEIVIRRDHLVEDGFHQLNRLGSRLKLSIHVSFVSECGLPEAGLDYGGLSKEFLTDMAKAAFDPRYGLFCQTSTSERLLIPNTAARFQENGIQMIEFLGRIVGKALYEGILLDYSFSNVFVQKLLGRYNFIDELSTLDPELYKNLMCVKHYDGDVKELSLDFTVTEEVMGKRHVIELKPGGQDTSVTNKNKLQYIHAIADYKLNRQILPFSNAFFRGLADLISPSWLKLFNASEFNQLLSGGNHDIDVDDLRRNTRYTGGYSEGSRTVKLFWEVMAGFEPKERCMLLKFVTSCSRAPLLGFKHLQPSFTIHKVPCDVPLWGLIGGQDVERLPSASTCYNTLKLPTYKRASTLKAKLLYAINSNAGFELS